MQEDGATLLSTWANFYVIIGSSSAALTGLMFVVITLVPEARRRAGLFRRGVSVFCTPTIVHFGAVLLASAILAAPWRVLAPVGLAVGLNGLAGIAYGAVVVRRMRNLTDYAPVFEDWLWHASLPLVAYLTLLVAGVMLPGSPAGALFGIGSATLLLLFVGIHNAWDTVTYIALNPQPAQDEPNR